MCQLHEKIAVVTGSGIGKAGALLFAKQDAEVHEIDLNEEACDLTVKEIYAKN
jgi:NAD(P)-dependent dehydrogenase (short-subunit alcohol dehydrogenase family)